MMDTEAKDVNGCMSKSVASLDAQKLERHANGEDDSDSNGEDDSDSKSLLLPLKEEMSRKSANARRKVQWNDEDGNKLAEVLEFVPSDTEDEDSESCICTIM